MKFCRVQKDDRIFYARMDGDTLHELAGDLFGDARPTGTTYQMDEVKLLAPVMPSKVVCLGKNYLAHALEFGSDAPEEPLLFMKPSTSVIAQDEAIVWPPDCKRLDYEAELAIVIGKRCKDVAQEDFRDVIFGYTCLNDVTARDLQPANGQWTRSKSFDTFCPLGPWIETEIDPFDVQVSCRLNGETRQDASTSLLIHPIDKLIAYISRVMTLLPGDIIATGTPAGIGGMAEGDTVEVEIAGIGVLRNHVVKK